jgi:uncharacterized protein
VIQVSLVGVRVEVPTNQPIVLLREDAGNRHLPIFIGAPEATAIVYALQDMPTPRPMTHDLLKNVLDEVGITVTRVDITELSEGTFYAQIHMVQDGKERVMDSRPSDALALAVRCGSDVSIFVHEQVLDEAGVVFDQTETDGMLTTAMVPEAEIDEFREFLDQINPEDFA